MKKDALSWLLFSKYPVIHRGVIRGDCLEHNKEGQSENVSECLRVGGQLR